MVNVENEKNLMKSKVNLERYKILSLKRWFILLFVFKSTKAYRMLSLPYILNSAMFHLQIDEIKLLRQNICIVFKYFVVSCLHTIIFELLSYSCA
jgi:hypothetical protein